MLLTDDERRKFVEWLELEAITSDGFARKLEEMQMPKPLIDKMKMEAAAATIIAKKLRSIESQTI